ncbi:MAG: hypothetical protein HC779_02925 [Phyllobacteriaceae bacterium]|nr:hypothetical protein [Phyllobacteriaceae bacterium]
MKRILLSVIAAGFVAAPMVASASEVNDPFGGRDSYLTTQLQDQARATSGDIDFTPTASIGTAEAFPAASNLIINGERAEEIFNRFNR